MKDTYTIAVKELKFAPIEVLITTFNFFKAFPMNRLTAFWRLVLCFFVVLLSSKTNLVDAKNHPTPHISTPNLQAITLYAARKTAAVGDLVTIQVTTGGFQDVEDLVIPMGWNPSLLSYQGVSGLSTEMVGFTAANFTTTNTATGSLIVNWTGIIPSSITDGMPFFTITFRVIAYSGLPANVVFTDIPFTGPQLSIHTVGGAAANVTYSQGRVTITDSNPCAPRPAGLSCQTAPILNATEFPYYNLLPSTNVQTVPALGNVCTMSIENNNWLSFIAASTDLSLKLKATNCTGGPLGTGNGLQFAVYETSDCNTFEKVLCSQSGTIPETESTFDLMGLTIGRQYYMMVDGSRNDICTYVLSIGSGQVYNSTQAIPAPTITGQSFICGARTGLTYSIPSVTNASSYIWRIPSSATATTPTSGATQTSLGVNWGTVSDSVCVKIVSRCDTTKWFCKSVKVGTTVTKDTTVTKCATACYRFGGTDRCAAADYTATFTAASGCDSIVTLHLLNYPAVTKDTTVFKCSTACYMFDGIDRCTADNYTAIFTSFRGCDSVVTLHLLNYPTVTKEISETKCASACYSFNGIDRCAAGDYTATFRTFRGCDSVVTLHLSNTPAITKEITVSKCATVCYPFGGTDRCAAGNYTATFRSASGCDSIVTLHLLDYPPVTKEIFETKCASACYTFGGIDRCAAGDYTATFRSFLGCDSVVTLHLTNTAAITKEISQSKCASACYTFGGTDRCAAGDYTATFRAASGCDSIVTLHLSNYPAVTKDTTVLKCASACYTFGGIDRCAAGDYTATFRSFLGCDSVVTLHLTNTAAITKEISQSKCTQSCYTFGGIDRCAAGDYTATFRAASGCDSIVTLHLSNYPPITKDTTILKCASACYTFNGIDRCAAGDYTATFRSFLGCDSIVTLHLTNTAAVTKEITVSKCATACYSFNGIDRCAAGDYTVTFRSSSGCDSIVTLHLLNYPPITKDTTILKCASACYTFNGIDRCAAGDYTATFRSFLGCDSVVTLHLTNTAAITKEITVSKCATACYSFNGIDRCATGDYTATFRSASGCDSIVTLHLSNYPPITKEINEVKCASACYNFGGIDRCAAGDYTATFRSFLGCDSVVTLHLSNTAAITKEITATKCGTACYSFNGIDRCAAGDYTATFRSASGCDSIVTLHLLNALPVTRDTTVSKCAQDCISFGGTDRCAAGDYTATFRAFSGCDSVVTLHLLNYPQSSKTIDTTVCLGTSVVVGGRTYSTPNTYTITVPRGSFRGCDSLITLKLTVIDFIVTASKSGDITCAVPQVTVSSRVQNQPANATIAYEWKNSSGTPIGTTPSVSVNQGGTFTVFASVTLNGKTCTKTDTITVTKSGNQPSKPTIAGQNTSCEGRNETFVIPTPAANVTHNWTVSNGTFTTQTNQITTTWNTNATTSMVCVNAQNACGSSDTACISVQIGRIPPPLSIIGNSTVCQEATATYRVTQAPNTTLVWTVTNGTAQNALTTDSLRVLWAAINGRVTVAASSRCGNGTPAEMLVQISNVLPDLVPIQGNNIPCSNDTTVYTVAPSATTTDYLWQVPTGATILRGQGTRTISVIWGSFSGNGQVFLTTKNACQLAQGASFPVVVKNAALAAPTINGNRTVCPSTQISFSTPQNPDIRSYTWTVPADAIILRGSGTDSIRVNWDIAPSGQVCLDVVNSCGTRKRTCVNIEVRADLDSLVIAGGTIACKDSTLKFCVPDDGSASRFLWQIPTITGGTIVSGQGTSCVNVRFASTGGTVRVIPVGGCSDGKLSRRDVVVKLPPSIVGSIAGRNNVCNQAIETYSVQPQADITRYSWGLPTGATFVGDSIRNSISVNMTNATSGFVTVRSSNDCGFGSGATMRITVIPLPEVNAGLDSAFCGQVGRLKGVSTGATNIWGVVTKPSGATVSFAFPDSTQTGVTVSKSGVYIFRLESSNSGICSKVDSVMLTFRDLPTVNIADQNCNLEATYFHATLNVVGNGSPFSIGGSAFGAFSGSNTFLSDTIASGKPYFFVVTDAFGCKSDTIRGTKICPCYTSAGTLRPDSLVVCFGATGKAISLGDAKLDGNDTPEYLLHNGTPTRIGSVLIRNKTGVFAFDSSVLVYNRPYYITFIVGDQQANGSVDTTKRCVSQTRGIPIIFKDKVTAGLVGDTLVCRSSVANFRFTTNQTGIFDITYRANGGALTFALALQNNSKISATPSESTTYRLVEATDKNGCKAVITDSARINLRPLPISNAGNDRSVCQNQVQLAASENLAYIGKWTTLTSGVRITNTSDPRTTVTNLQNGRNIFIWTVNDTTCSDYSVRDTVQIFLPLVPKAINLSLITKVGVTISGNVSESAPVGTYSVTRLTNPERGRFDLFSNGSFTYIPDTIYQGVVKFKYIICSDLCTGLCDTGEVRILIQPRQDTVKFIQVQVPSGITPNGDGRNDALVIDGIDQFSENELVIFNRWGDILYKSKPYRNDWQGTNQSGSSLPEGTYYYVLRLNTADGKILRGDITILR